MASIKHILAFTTKELLEILKQPLLIVILLIGPLLIVLAFGFTYQGTPARLRALLVLPDPAPPNYPADQIRYAATASFSTVTVTSDRQQALADLRNGYVDIVEIWPDSLDAVIVGQEQIAIEFHTNLINPFVSGYAQAIAYGQIAEINKALLGVFFERGKAELAEAETFLRQAKEEISAIRASAARVPQIRAERFLAFEQAANLLIAQGKLLSIRDRNEIIAVRDDLRALREAIQQGQLAAGDQRLADTAERITLFEQRLQILAALPADVVISPLAHVYLNSAQVQPSSAAFFSPRLIALMLQHWAMTLAALSLVRERLVESIEIYRVSPITPFQMLIGKSLGLIVIVAGLGFLLVLMTMGALNVPFLGEWWRCVLEALLMVLSAMGVGFVISAIVKTDSQAVQLSMLILLLSIFFSGFLLLLDGFLPIIDAISNVMPLKHGLILFQDEFFAGRFQSPAALFWLMGLTIGAYSWAWWLTTRQFRR